MRFLPPLLAALLATTTITTSVAFACGDPRPVDPAPRVLAVSTHGFVGTHERWTHRAFVVLEKSIDADDSAWKWLAPATYDATHILMMSRLATPMELTLVGPSGTRVVKADKQVALSRTWGIGVGQKRLALEVPVGNRDRFSVAIAGRATDATWRELGDSQESAAATWWLQQQGITNPQYVRVQTIAGTAFELVEYYKDGMAHVVARGGDRELGLAADASPLGAVTTAGRTFVVFSMTGQIGLLELPATTKV